MVVIVMDYWQLIEHAKHHHTCISITHCKAVTCLPAAAVATSPSCVCDGWLVDCDRYFSLTWYQHRAPSPFTVRIVARLELKLYCDGGDLLYCVEPFRNTRIRVLCWSFWDARRHVIFGG